MEPHPTASFSLASHPSLPSPCAFSFSTSRVGGPPTHAVLVSFLTHIFKKPELERAQSINQAHTASLQMRKLRHREAITTRSRGSA